MSDLQQSYEIVLNCTSECKTFGLYAITIRYIFRNKLFGKFALQS